MDSALPPQISAFWFQRTHGQDDRQLLEETDRLPPLKQLTPLQLVRILYRLGVYHKTYGIDGTEPSTALKVWNAMRNEWLLAAAAQLKDFDPQNFANALSSFVRLKETLPKIFEQAFLQRIERKLPRFNATDLGDTARAVRKLAFDIPESFREKLIDYSEKKADRFTEIGTEHILFFLSAYPSDSGNALAQDLFARYRQTSSWYTIGPLIGTFVALRKLGIAPPTTLSTAFIRTPSSPGKKSIRPL